MDTQKHYIAMNGSTGCLPDGCQVCETRKDAVEVLAFIYQLGRTRKPRLMRDGILYVGNEYCEIQECDCEHPEIHSDN